MNELFTDGGVISKNPSPIAGTWAFRLLQDDQVVHEESGVVLPQTLGVKAVTNNQTEMYAVLLGLDRAGASWSGTVFSDSQVTLGRLFGNFKWSNIPPVMHMMFQSLHRQMCYFRDIQCVLLQGHPTQADLLSGIGKKHGFPVSEHNAWCDHACGEAARRYLAELKAGVSTETASDRAHIQSLRVIKEMV